MYGTQHMFYKHL